jgi:hypothetical protein
MASSELSNKTQRCIEVLFAEVDRDAAAALLRQDCGFNLPGLSNWTAEEAVRGLERVRLAALKVSNGNLATLREAIMLARTDWRDLLVGAGFGDDPAAHLKWAP